MQIWNETLEHHGMKINKKKTKVMLENKDSQAVNLQINGQE